MQRLANDKIILTETSIKEKMPKENDVDECGDGVYVQVGDDNDYSHSGSIWSTCITPLKPWRVRYIFKVKVSHLVDNPRSNEL